MNARTHDYTVAVARSPEEVEALRPAWAAFHSHPNAEIDFYLTIVRHRPGILRPHVIAISRDGKPEMLVVGRIERERLRLPLGYKRIHANSVRRLTVVYGGLLGEQSPELCQVAHAELQTTLSRGEVDLLNFDHLRSDSTFYRTALDHYPLLLRDWTFQQNPHHQLSVSCAYEDFLRRLSKGTRKSLNRYATRLIGTYGSRLSIERLEGPECATRLIEDTEAVASKTYQRALGVGFTSNAETQRWIALELSRGRFRGYLAYIDGHCVAFSHILLDGDTAYAMDTGYDPGYAPFRIGHFLNCRVIEELCADPRVIALDFGFGDADYKQSLCDSVWNETTLNVYAATPAGLASKAVLGSGQTISMLGRGFLKRMNLLRQAKRLWRKRLRRNQQLQLALALSGVGGIEALPVPL